MTYRIDNEFSQNRTVLSTSSATETIIAADEEGTYYLLFYECRLIAFKAKLDTEEGGLMWNPSYDVQNDYKTALSTSQMVSMLHDTRRNELYKKAINEIIQDFIRENNRPPTVLDVGSGTGLLSLLAAEAGASKVLAFEQMKILTDISTQVIADNGYNSKITVLNLKSTQISDENEDLKCDIMVSEILDSILLGEGVIPTVRHAKKYLLNKNNKSNQFKIIPSNACVYGGLIYSKSIEEISSIENMYIEYNNGEVEHLSGSDEEDKCMGGVNCLPV